MSEILNMDDYNAAKDAGANNQEIPQDLLDKYESQPELLKQVHEGYNQGKKNITRSRLSRRDYGRKMEKKRKK